MSCKNHPNVPTVATCNRCKVEMCGMCAQFLDSGEYCEKCADAVQSEDFVKTKSRDFNKREEIFAAPEPEESTFSPPTRAKDKDRFIIWLGAGGGVSMIFFALLLYAFPNVFEFDPVAAAAREAAYSLENCLYKFQDIGVLLEEGEIPAPSMRCEESNVPNIITRNGDEVRVSHPNPGFHGFSELYVTNFDHEPTTVL